ncbi:hypothetical protein [Nocardia spumae]|nr:hypothetical protein [Nocardia spumae]
MAQLPDGAAYTNIFHLFAGAAVVAFVLALVLLRYYDRPSTGGTAH